VKRLAKFIGVECTEEQAKKVRETCSFENMKKAEVTIKEKILYDKEEGKSQIFRKGKKVTIVFVKQQIYHYYKHKRFLNS